MGAHAYGRVYVSLLPVVEACVVVRGRVCEVRVASTADEAEAIIMIVDLTLSYIWRLGNYFVRRLHYAAGKVRSYTLYFPMHRRLWAHALHQRPQVAVSAVCECPKAAGLRA